MGLREWKEIGRSAVSPLPPWLGWPDGSKHISALQPAFLTVMNRLCPIHTLPLFLVSGFTDLDV